MSCKPLPRRTGRPPASGSSTRSTSAAGSHGLWAPILGPQAKQRPARLAAESCRPRGRRRHAPHLLVVFRRVQEAPQLDLDVPRDAGDLIATTLVLFARHALLFLSVTLLVVGPLVVLVNGIWLRDASLTGPAQMFSRLRCWRPLLAFLMPVLVTALHVMIVRDLGEGRVPSSRAGAALRRSALPTRRSRRSRSTRCSSSAGLDPPHRSRESGCSSPATSSQANGCRGSDAGRWTPSGASSELVNRTTGGRKRPGDTRPSAGCCSRVVFVPRRGWRSDSCGLSERGPTSCFYTLVQVLQMS